MYVTPSVIEMEVKPLQPRKASFAIPRVPCGKRTFDGQKYFTSTTHPDTISTPLDAWLYNAVAPKTLFSMAVTLSGIEIDARTVHPLKASRPMDFTPSGRVTADRAVQSANARYSSRFTPGGKWMDAKAVQPANDE